MSFGEIKTLCSYCRIPLDHLFHLKNQSFILSGPLIDQHNCGFGMYFDCLLAQLNYFNSFERRELHIIRKSALLSYVGGKERRRFFKCTRDLAKTRINGKPGRLNPDFN